MRRFGLRVVFLLGAVLLVARASQAQVAIAGSVKDTTGAVMPGVTVEASSPALIEKSRSVVTGANGQYQIVDLRPGEYAVTFTLPGFKSIRRTGIILEGNFTAPVNAELQVGAVEETVTVNAQSPTVFIRASVARGHTSSPGCARQTLPTTSGQSGNIPKESRWPN